MLYWKIIIFFLISSMWCCFKIDLGTWLCTVDLIVFFSFASLSIFSFVRFFNANYDDGIACIAPAHCKRGAFTHIHLRLPVNLVFALSFRTNCRLKTCWLTHAVCCTWLYCTVRPSSDWNCLFSATYMKT